MIISNNIAANSYTKIRTRNYTKNPSFNEKNSKFLRTTNLSKFDNNCSQSLKSVVFSGNLKADNDFCHLIIHGASAACGGISFAQGEASVTGIDTWVLRGVQGLMFRLLGDKLGAPGGATIIYGAKEMFSGASVGVGWSKQIIGLTGIAAHGASAVTGASAATGGTSHAAISGTVGAINGSLSAIITEKMGWGFVKRVKQNKMNWKDQLSEASSYLTTRGLMSGLDVVGESAESVKELIQNCPEGSRAALGTIYNLVHESGADTYSGMFFINLGTRYGSDLLSNNWKLTREQKSEIIKDSIFDTAAFIAADRLIEHGVNEKVLKERQKIEAKFNSAPEVFQDFMVDIKHSELHDLISPSKDTLNKFKDKNNLIALTDTIKEIQQSLIEHIKEAEKSFKEAQLIKIENQKKSIKKTQIAPKLIDPIQLAKEKKTAIVPNCVMIVGSNPEINDELILWAGQTANCRFTKIDHDDDILGHLKKAEEKYLATGDRSLIYINNFEKLINPSITPGHVIADLKNLMVKTSEKYHSTIIFSTTDPSKLDNIAIQPHRVEKIDANIKE